MTRENDALIAAIEAGGTKFVCSLASGPDDIRCRERISTAKPEETLKAVIDTFEREIAEYGRPEAIGIGTFGPVDVDPVSKTYGFITSTPKPGWQQADLLGTVARALDLPAFIDTDVNAAAMGEAKWGAAQGLNEVVYLTIGTGVGGGVLLDGKPVHGLLHPEIGHMRLPRQPEEKEAFAGNCSYHGDCLEGLAAGPAIEARWGKPASELDENHEAWEVEAEILALALVNLILTVSPKRIVMGGGVMHQAHLFPMIRKRVVDLLAGYVDHPAILENIDSYIVPPGLGDNAGLLGAVVLGQQGLERTR